MTDVKKAIKHAHIQGTIDGVVTAFNAMVESLGELPSEATLIRDGLLEALRERLATVV